MKKYNSLNILLHPIFLSSLLLLIINDHYLKSNFPSFMSGKISDFAGLFVFPIFLSSVANICFSKYNLTFKIYIFTVVLFSCVKFIPINIWFPSNSWGIVPYIIADNSDLIALIILPISYRFYKNNSFRYLPKINFNLIKIIIPITCFAIIATSPASYNYIFKFPSPNFQKLKSGYNHTDFEDILSDNNYSQSKKELDGSNINYKYFSQEPIIIDSASILKDYSSYILFCEYDLTLNERGYFFINQIDVTSYDETLNEDKAKYFATNKFLKSIEEIIE